jgi:hypothetical protein
MALMAQASGESREGVVVDANATRTAAATYVRVLLGFVLVGLALIAGLNWSVNPLGFYQTHWIRPLTWSSRTARVALIDSAATPPGVLVLGSSRSMSVHPDDIRELTGLPAVNLAVDQARAEDLWALYRYAVEVHGWAPKEIILGLDLEAFHNHAVADDRLIASPALRPLLPDSIRKAAFWRQSSALLSGDQASRALQSLWFTATAFPPHTYQFDEVGFIHYLVWDRQIAEGRFHADIAGSVPEYITRFMQYTAVDPDRWALFAKLVQSASQRGMTIRSYLTPLHPEVQPAVEKATAFTRVHQDAVDHLRALERTTPAFHFRDFTDLQSFGGQADLFYDGGHMRSENVRLMVRSLYGR